MELPSYAELTKKDAEILSHYVQGAERYVEIGTKGGGSAFVVTTANPNLEAHGVDPDDSHLMYRHPNFEFHRVPSLEAVSGWNIKGLPIDTLFIDANHDQAGVDWWVWSRHVKPGGYVLFHDYAAHSPIVIEDCERILTIPGWELVRRPQLPQELSSIFVCRKSLPS